MKIEPLGVTVFIELDKVEEKKVGMLIIPTETDSMHMDTGVITAIGPLAFEDQPEKDLKPGDRVVFNRYSGKEIKDERGHTVSRIMADSEIWGRILEEDGK